MTPQEIVEEGLAALGAERGAVLVEHTSTANLRWANSSMTTNGLTASHRVHVVAHPSLAGGPGSGSASGMVAHPADVVGLLARARRAAADAGPAHDEADEPAARPASADWDASPGSTDPGQLAPATGLLAEVLSEPGIEIFGYAEHTVTTTYLGTSGGLRLRHEQPTGRFELCGKSHDRTRSAWAGRSGRDLAALDLASTTAEVRRGLAAQQRRVPLDPGRHRVLLSPSAAADLLIYLLWSAGLRDAIEGRSAFAGSREGSTRLGSQLSEMPFWLRSDPAAAGVECADHCLAVDSSSTTSAFDLGLPLRATDWIRDGRLSALASTQHAAAGAGLAPTPPIDNLLAGVEGRAGTLDEVATRLEDGLLVTCLWYIREVDPQTLLLTGLTRDGVYVVRHGEIVAATGNVRFNESPLGMLGRLSDAGAPVDCLPREWADWFTRARVAPLVVDGFHLSTTSDAV